MMLSLPRMKTSLVRSMREANEHYYNMTGGEWVTERGVESFLAYHVSSTLKDIVGVRGHVMVEVSMKQLLSKVAPLKRNSPYLKAGNRIDVVVTDNLHQPVAIVELKRNTYLKLWQSDADRILAIMKVIDQIEIGVFAVLMSEERGDTWLSEQLSAIRQHVRSKNAAAKKKLAFTGFERTFPWMTGEWEGEAWPKAARYSIAGFIISRPS